MLCVSFRIRRFLENDGSVSTFRFLAWIIDSYARHTLSTLLSVFSSDKHELKLATFRMIFNRTSFRSLFCRNINGLLCDRMSSWVTLVLISFEHSESKFVSWVSIKIWKISTRVLIFLSDYNLAVMANCPMCGPMYIPSIGDRTYCS